MKDVNVRNISLQYTDNTGEIGVQGSVQDILGEYLKIL